MPESGMSWFPMDTSIKNPLINLCKVIDAANIDLKSMDDSIYLKLNAGKLEPILYYP